MVRCAECGRYLTEREWAANGKRYVPLDHDTDTLAGLLGALFLAGEVHQFCSPACEEQFDQ